MTPPHVAVIILTVNQRDTTLRCLESFRQVRGPRHTLVVWDNGSTDGTADAVRAAFPDVIVHRHPANLGVAGGRNAGAALAIKALNPSHLLFIDNDSVATPDFLDTLLRALAADDRVGQVLPKLLMLHHPSRIDSVGIQVKFWLAECRSIGQWTTDEGQHDTPTTCVADGHFLIRTSTFEEIGGFDTAFDPYGYQGVDFSLRVKQAGYKIMVIPQAVVLHEGSRTPFKENFHSKEYFRLKLRNFLRFLRKNASTKEKLAFVVFGIPYLALRGVIRAGRRGNLSAVQGVLGGLADLWRSGAGTAGRRAGKR